MTKFKQITGLTLTVMLAFALIGCPITAGSGGNTLATPKYTVNFAVDGGNGSLKAEVDGAPMSTGDKVQMGKTVKFTATPTDSTYDVDFWTLTGGSFTAGGTSGSPTAEVTVGNANLTVKVTFRFRPAYVKVDYKDLEKHLTSLSEPGPYYIEVTGTIPPQDLRGEETTKPQDQPKPSKLGELIQGAKSKTIALRLPQSIAGLTDMTLCFCNCTNLISLESIPDGVQIISACFGGCTGLTTAPNIPESVTNMDACFGGCTGLTTAPNIPNTVTNMRLCFDGCTKLTTVPNISDNVTDMFGCFSGCTNLTTVPNIPESVTNMGVCFVACTKLTGVTLKCNYDGEGEAFYNTFSDCTGLPRGG